MMTLILLSSMGLLAGGVSGLATSGTEGLILGASSGLVVGVMIWALVSMAAQWRRERRLDSYFVHGSQTLERER